ncbi:MAG: DUF3794 domain-containing protein [Eubacteriales bacterium]|nr:DUF3794 domain-containing protein [Eubacteriales bacterium]
MLELVKQNIHMNRWKNQMNTQITLDDDFNVPDVMSDIAQVILDSGEIQMEPAKIQSGRVTARGRLDFHVLYRTEEGGLQTLGGELPFEEAVNVPGLEERDYVSIAWQLEDLEADVINSRKLSIRAVVTLEVKAEELFDAEAAVELADTCGGSAAQIETRRSRLEVAAIALRKKDTHRVKEQLALSGSKPAIDRILWTETRLTGTSVRPLDGKIRLEGSLQVFVIYEGEGDSGQIQWMEETIPFSGETELSGAAEEMIPAVGLRLIHKSIEEKPDYDGEMRELDVDAVIELDIRLYEERPLEILSDLYAMDRELKLETGEACFDRILTRNSGKCRIAEKAELGAGQRILQICRSCGNVKLDEVAPGQDVLSMDGVVEVEILYLTDDDSRPVQSVTELVPFHYEAEAPGITENSVWYLESGVEQLTAVMAGGGTAEIRAVIALELLVLQPVKTQVILQAEEEPLDLKRLQQLPGIAGYVVQEGDSLWDIARRFHTTEEHIISANGLASGEILPGDRLILVKEIGR